MNNLAFKHGLYAKRNDLQNKNYQFPDIKIISNTFDFMVFGIHYSLLIFNVNLKWVAQILSLVLKWQFIHK